MRYEKISKASADMLTEQGYVLKDGDRAFIDETTMMILTEDPEDEQTDDAIIRKVVFLAKLHLQPRLENEETVMESSGFIQKGNPSGNLWDGLVQYISSKMRPKGK